MQYVKIPADRVPVLIGEGGESKRTIESRTKTKLTIEDTEVSIDGESLDEWVARDVVKAVGRGFSPEKALMLLSDENVLEIIDLSDFSRGTDKDLARVRGRIIGEKGKSRRVIEKLTDCFVSVYGKTACVIGSYSWAPVAREAVEMIASGAPHSRVYKFLEKQQGQGR